MLKNNQQLILPRPLSWSGMTLLEANEEAWVAKYLNGEDVDFSNDGMSFGKRLADHLEEETDDIEMGVIGSQLIPLDNQEFPLSCELKTVKGKIPLFGKLDRSSVDLGAIREVKTGQGEAWTQAKAEKHGQLHFYATMIHTLKRKIPTIWLDWVKTEKIDGGVFFTGQIKSFEVKLNLVDILKMKKRILKNAIRIDYLTTQHLKNI